MSGRAAAWLGWSAWVVAVGLAAFAFVLTVLSVGVEPSVERPGGAPSVADAVGGGVYLAAVVAFATVGALLVTRGIGNRIAWVLLAIAVVVAGRVMGAEYGDYALLLRPGSLPGGRFAVAIGEAVSTPMFALLGLAILLFPDGRLSSRRWRWVLWVLGVAAVAGLVGSGLAPGPFRDAEAFDRFTNPLGVGSDPSPFEGLAGLGWLLVTLGLFASGVAMVRRMRRAHGIERLQLKWMAFAASLFAAGFVVISITFFAELSGPTIDAVRTGLLGLGFCTIPVAAGIAILRYRLYDIDVVINRTLVYAGLTATLAAAYLGSVLLLQLALSAMTSDSGLAVAASTLAVAALFRPARSRIQVAVDHRFYRRRYDARRTLDAFTATLRDQVELGALTGELRAVVGETLQPAHVSLWLRESQP